MDAIGNVSLILRPDASQACRPGTPFYFTLQVNSGVALMLDSGWVKFSSTMRVLRMARPVVGAMGQPIVANNLVGWLEVGREDVMVRTLALPLNQAGDNQPGGSLRVVNWRDDPSVVHLHVRGPRQSAAIVIKCRLDLPHQLPDSWSRDLGRDFHVDVIHRVDASVAVRRLTPNAPLWRLSVHRDLHLVKVPRDISSLADQEESGDTHSGKLVIWEPEIGLQLTVRDKGVVRGEDIPLIVKINNPTRTDLRNVYLTFITQYTFMHDQNKGLTMEEVREKGHKLRLPTVARRSEWHYQVAGFKVPANCDTSSTFDSCAKLIVDFFVRLKVKGRVKATRVEAPVKVGIQSQQRQSLPPCDLPVWSPPQQ